MATVGKEICVLEGEKLEKKVLTCLDEEVISLLVFPKFDLEKFPFVGYFCAKSVGFADLRTDGKYRSIANDKGAYPHNSTSKMQLIEVDDDGSLLFATTRGRQVATFRIK